MGLYKVCTLPDGQEVSYWIVQELTVDRLAKRLHFTLAPYLTKEAREAGHSPVMHAKRAYTIEDIVYPEDGPHAWRTRLDFTKYFLPVLEVGKPILPAIYGYVKEHLFYFEGSEDC